MQLLLTYAPATHACIFSLPISAIHFLKYLGCVAETCISSALRYAILVCAPLVATGSICRSRCLLPEFFSCRTNNNAVLSSSSRILGYSGDSGERSKGEWQTYNTSSTKSLLTTSEVREVPPVRMMVYFDVTLFPRLHLLEDAKVT